MSTLVLMDHVSCVCCVLSHLSHVQLFVTPWTVACQAPVSVGFSRQILESEVKWVVISYSRGPVLLMSPALAGGIKLPSRDPGIKPVPLMCPALAGRFFTTSATWIISVSNLLQY